MVEHAPKVAAALEENARLLDAGGRLQIVRADAVKFASSLTATGVRFDVLFLDPPYKQGWIERLAPLLTEPGDSGELQALAASTGIRRNTLAVQAHRMRQRLRQLVRLELLQTVGSRKALEEELAELRDAMDEIAG